MKPSREIALARNDQRDDPNKESLKTVIEQVYEALTIDMFDWTGWHILDTSYLSVAETIKEILGRTK